MVSNVMLILNKKVVGVANHIEVSKMGSVEVFEFGKEVFVDCSINIDLQKIRFPLRNLIGADMEILMEEEFKLDIFVQSNGKKFLIKDALFSNFDYVVDNKFITIKNLYGKAEKLQEVLM